METRQLPAPVLAGMVVAGLAIGALWWTSNPPPDGAPGAGSAVPPVALAAPHADPPQVQPTSAPTPEPPPRRNVILAAETVDLLLPAPDSAPLLRHGTMLEPGVTHGTTAPATPGPHLLQFACVTLLEGESAEVNLTIETSQTTLHRARLPCDGTLQEIQVDLPEELHIQVRHAEGDPVAVAYQLLRS